MYNCTNLNQGCQLKDTISLQILFISHNELTQLGSASEPSSEPQVIKIADLSIICASGKSQFEGPCSLNTSSHPSNPTRLRKPHAWM